MNVLTNEFPEAIKVGDQILNVDFDCRNCIRIILAWEDEALTEQEKAYITLNRLYEDDIENIENIDLALEKALKFLNCGEESDEASTKPKKRVYSFDKDSKFIYTAIDSVLDGRLSEGKTIHWWLFCMAFMEIPEDCMLSKIINLRTKKNKGKLSKDELRIYKDMIDILELEVDKESIMSDEELKNMEEFKKALGVK